VAAGIPRSFSASRADNGGSSAAPVARRDGPIRCVARRAGRPPQRMVSSRDCSPGAYSGAPHSREPWPVSRVLGRRRCGAALPGGGRCAALLGC